MNSDDDRAFTRNAAQLLDDSLDDIDAATLSRLHAARSRAIEVLEQQQRPASWWPSAAFAAAAVLVLTVALNLPQSSSLPAEPVPVIDDLELLSSKDNLDLYQDLEFYTWLAADESTG